MEAVQHAQAAGEWGLAARLLSDHWPDEYLSGRDATLGELVARFPREVIAADAELTAARVASDLSRGALDEAGRDLALAAKLGVHRRRQAVEQARALGLLAPIPRGS